MIDRSKKLPAFFYESALGKRPVREWILGLSLEDRKLVGSGIQKVEFGWPLGMPYCRRLKAAMAPRMQTSRRALDRLLDPTNTSVTLHTLQRAAVAIGRQLRLELI